MNTTPIRRSAAVLFTAAALALTGCAAVDDLVNRQATHTYDDADHFGADASVDAGWIPLDATEITLRTPAENAGDVAVILLVSDSELPESCVEAERRSAPILSVDGAPDVYEPNNSRIHVCDDWTVMKAADGWFGWTPNDGD
ncbi:MULTISPECIES: hypothetical protein [unclassified Agromyces]|uniref:hypothetical protein n=1 Tax=unclassified Agromyces TaxID=2639701 RepID=UPI003014C9CB